MVLSADPATGKQSYRRVKQTFTRTSDELLTIETADGRQIEATPEHPFWVEGKGFVVAKRLARSDLLKDADGRHVAVAAVTARRGTFPVYNFGVEGTHTYYASGWWVHNACDPGAQRVAEFLRGLGRRVEANPLEGMPGKGRQGDLLVDGVVHEVKSLRPGADSGTIKNRINEAIKGGGQARNFIIDVRGTGMSLDEAQRGVWRALGISVALLIGSR